MTTTQQQQPAANGKKPDAPPPDNRTPEEIAEDNRWIELRALIKNTVPAIKRALPAGSPTDPERFAWLCYTYVKTDFATQSDKEKALLWASDYSLQRCMVQAAELDLQPGSSLGQAFFIRRGWDAIFQIGVWGFVALMRRGDDVVEVWADVIYQNDTYRIVRGAHRDLQHEIDPCIPRAKRGEVLGAYACVKYSNGSVDWEFVNAEDLEIAKSTSKAKNSPAYENWPDEMRKRTALKRLAKYVEKCLAANRAADLDESDELREDLAEAIRVITVQGQELSKAASKQASTLDSIMAGNAPALPPHQAGQSAREQVEAGAKQQQGSEVRR